MSDQDLLARITASPDVLAGKPVIQGTRLSVELILNLLAHGSSMADILDEYEGLSENDIKACLLFSAHSLGKASFMPLTVESP